MNLQWAPGPKVFGRAKASRKAVTQDEKFPQLQIGKYAFKPNEIPCLSWSEPQLS